MRIVVHRVDPIPALKQQIGRELARLLDGWNTGDVAFEIGTESARISELRRGKLARFSLETLIRYVARLGRQVTITVQARQSLATTLDGETLRADYRRVPNRGLK